MEANFECRFLQKSRLSYFYPGQYYNRIWSWLFHHPALRLYTSIHQLYLVLKLLSLDVKLELYVYLLDHFPNFYI
mgnify:CR=1 FL=1